MELSLLKDAKVFGRTVFLRADLDVPLESQKSKVKSQKLIRDDTRLIASLPTIEYLLKNGAKVIVGGHLGRPDGVDKSLSLEPVVYWLQSHLEGRERSQGDFSSLSASRNDKNTIRKIKIGDFDGWQLGDNLFLLENLRFYRGEEENDKEFAKKLARLADIYVNDSFAASHRAHASIVGVPKYLPRFAGLRLQKEVGVLSGVLENPKRPLAVIIGGAKIETKLPLVEKMHRFADFVLVGGKIAKEVETLLKIKNKHTEEKHAVLVIAELNKDKTDISNKSVREFLEIIKNAGTVVWNGPIGKTQDLELITENSEEDTERGTRELAEGIVKSKAYTVVGGGDTVEFLNRIKLIDKFSFASTGGGAMLAYLSGEKLPGLAALTKT